MVDRLDSTEQTILHCLMFGEFSRFRDLERLDSYYEGEQRLQHLGLALPPELQGFRVAVNVPRMAVDEPVRRQQLKAFQRSGSATADPVLREAWEANNLPSQSMLLHRDARVFARSFVTVSESEELGGLPRIQVEDPRQFNVFVNPRTRKVEAAVRYFNSVAAGSWKTLFLPDQTIWLEDTAGNREVVVQRIQHNLGVVPVVGFINRPRAGRWDGRSEMADVIGLTDSIARMLTNLQVASETHAVPSRWVAGMSKGDFVDKEGKPIPVWEAYFTAIMMTANKDAKFGQFNASDLSNFHKSVDALLSYCAGVLGLPVRYFGQNTANPAAEGAIRADESRLIANVEAMNRVDGDSWCWVMGLYERLRTGEWPATNSIRAVWENPATSTLSERADAMMKLYSQGIISREGVWDEMGWDEARKDQERTYLAREASDPVTERIMRGIGSGGVGVGAAAVDDAGADRGVGVAGAAQG